MEIRKHCKDCDHCVWRNRWVCELTNWEFDFWIGHCDDFHEDYRY